MRKICHISTVHPLFDDRIFYKECISLEKHGYEVFYIVKHEKEEVINNIHICPLPTLGNRFTRLIRGNFLACSKAIGINARLCHFHDPELMIAGLILRILGKKIIYDVHEDLPKQVLYKEWIRYKWVRKIVSKFIYFVEKSCCLFFNGIVAATEDIQKKYPKMKTILLRNFPVKELISRSNPKRFESNSFRLIYIGGLSKVRGIVEIIQAIDILNGSVELILLGHFFDDDYLKQCQSLPGWKHVKYYSQVKHEDVFGYIEAADAGIAILYPLQNYITSLPVKIFEYMAVGKPVVLSDFTYWKEIFGKFAVFANPYNPTDIAEKIQTLLNDKSLRKELGENGRRAVVEKYSWESEEQRLLDLYNRVLENGN